MKIKLRVSLKNQIKKWLLTYPELRDNDYALIVKTWLYYHPSLLSSELKLSTFLGYFSSGAFIPPETIRRTRQKVQELFPHTRGANYYKRRKNIPDIINALKSEEMNK